jgi:signal transduction histidine kinase
VLLALAWAAQRQRLRTQRLRFAAVMRERTRIARDLHDSLAQSFAGLGYHLRRLRKRTRQAEPETRELVDELDAMVTRARLEARHSIASLRAHPLERRTLREALGEIGAAALANDVNVTVVAPELDVRLSADAKSELVAIAQEATTNAIVHGGAKSVSIVLTLDDERLTLAITDDGRGFDVEAATHRGGLHFGLAGIRERCERLSAAIELKSQPGQGTIVVVRLGKKSLSS